MLHQKTSLSHVEQSDLLNTLKIRFDNNLHRHKNINWIDVLKNLENAPEKLKSLFEMERTEGEPDVVGYEEKTKEFIFMDCSKESPKGRRSYCYDQKALDSRKKNKPKNNAITVAQEMGVDILTEEQYRGLQQLEAFDLKTSCWIKTPNEIRNLGGAIFCDRRYDKVFTYHNGAESYYAARGFRTFINI